MRIGIFGGEHPPDTQVERARRAADQGFASYVIPQIFGFDALAVCGLIGREVPDIEVGTAVVPIYGRHPMVLASQALTASTLSGGRLMLGIGLSHQVVVETMWGYSYAKPLTHMREYLEALLPLLRGESVAVNGETVTTNGSMMTGDVAMPSVVLAALGPKMLELAGTVADGTVTWMTGRHTLGDHIGPSIRAAADAAGRPEPRVAAGLPVCVTDDEAGARERAGKIFAMYGGLPSYRAMMDREGVDGPEGLAIVGSAEQVREEISLLAEAGVTDFAAVEFSPDPDEDAATRELLVSLL